MQIVFLFGSQGLTVCGDWGFS